jgi:hypothetical protein
MLLCHVHLKICKFREGDQITNVYPLKSVGTQVMSTPSLPRISALLKIAMRATLSPPVGPRRKRRGGVPNGKASGNWILKILYALKHTSQEIIYTILNKISLAISDISLSMTNMNKY